MNLFEVTLHLENLHKDKMNRVTKSTISWTFDSRIVRIIHHKKYNSKQPERMILYLYESVNGMIVRRLKRIIVQYEHELVSTLGKLLEEASQ